MPNTSSPPLVKPWSTSGPEPSTSRAYDRTAGGRWNLTDRSGTNAGASDGVQRARRLDDRALKFLRRFHDCGKEGDDRGALAVADARRSEDAPSEPTLRHRMHGAPVVGLGERQLREEADGHARGDEVEHDGELG